MDAKRVAIVTGASQGIGKATALRLAQDFSALVLAAREQDELDATAAEVRRIGADALAAAGISEVVHRPLISAEIASALARSLQFGKFGR